MIILNAPDINDRKSQSENLNAIRFFCNDLISQANYEIELLNDEVNKLKEEISKLKKGDN